MDTVLLIYFFTSLKFSLNETSITTVTSSVFDLISSSNKPTNFLSENQSSMLRKTKQEKT